MMGGHPDWFNLHTYTPLEMVLFAGGCWLWVIAYIIIIRNIRKYKFVEMPTVAGTGNFAWEFVFSWIAPYTDMGWVPFAAYRAWFFLDMYIWYNVVKYAEFDTLLAAFRKYKYWYLGIMLAVWIIGFQTFRWSGLEWIIGARTAYFLNAVIAVQYVINYLRLGPKYPFSIHVAWMKGLGTGMNTVFMFIHFPEDVFLHFCGVVIAICDVIYFTMLLRDRRRGIKPLDAPLPIPDPA